MLRMQDQQLGNLLRLNTGMILTAIDFIRGDGFQDGHPLMIVGGLESAVEQLVVFDVNDSRGHGGALESAAGLQEIPAFVVGQRVIGYTVKAMASELDDVAEAMRADGEFLFGLEAHDGMIEAVD